MWNRLKARLRAALHDYRAAEADVMLDCRDCFRQQEIADRIRNEAKSPVSGATSRRVLDR